MNLAPPHILVVDDDSRLRQLLVRYLTEHGCIATPAMHAADARDKLTVFQFDLIILDRMMPGQDGVAFARDLRQQSTVPILMLTAMGETDQRIAGLEAGVDDYLPKPFEPKELLLRIRSILKRALIPLAEEQELHFGPYRFQRQKRLLWRGGEQVALTESEAQLLAALAEKPGEPISRGELARVSGEATGNERSIDVLVTRLRKKIESNPAKPLYIHTVRGAGYTLRL